MMTKNFQTFMEQYHPYDSTPPRDWDTKAADYRKRGLKELEKYALQRAAAQRKKVKDSGLGNKHPLMRKEDFSRHTMECPTCNAPAGQPCRELTPDGHQRIMRKGHHARRGSSTLKNESFKERKEKYRKLKLTRDVLNHLFHHRSRGRKLES